MKWHTGIGNDVLAKVSSDDCICMYCQKVSEICEVICTEDEDSYKGYQVWIYCPNCDAETFKTIEP